jgi:hypothetical protein
LQKGVIKMSFSMRIRNQNLINEDMDEENEFLIVHPLYDKEEEKCNPDNLAPMQMTKSRKYSLLILRVYLIMMICLAVYRVLYFAGVFGRILP